MRLDKFLSEMNLGSRSQIKDYIRKKQVMKNGEFITKPETQVDPKADEIYLNGKKVVFESFQYFLLNKPAGVVSATRDALSATVLSLLPKDIRGDLFPVGRLDKDTEGLLLITNDGELAHQLLSPKKHVSKTYLAKLAKPLSEADRQLLEAGIDIGDETPTLPAKVVCLNRTDQESWIRLTISEGRYHQVKRMLETVGNEVIFLKRLRFGPLSLDKKLSAGECRKLTDSETEALKHANKIADEKKALLQGKKAVIFDLDGSLVDSMWLWGKIDIEYLERFGHDQINLSALRKKIEGMSFYETAVYFKERFGIPDSIEKMVSDWNKMAWEKYEKEVPLKDGVLEFLHGCKDNHLLLGIATSNSRELTTNVLRAQGIIDYFSVITTGSDITKGKPAPDVYLETARQLNVAPAECLVFEDILLGIMAGKNAGMTVCAVSDDYSAHQLTEKKELADYFIEDYYDFFD